MKQFRLNQAGLLILSHRTQRVGDDEATRDLDIHSRTSHAEQLHVMPCRSSGLVCRRSVTSISVATFGCSSISTAIVLSKYQLNLQ